MSSKTNPKINAIIKNKCYRCEDRRDFSTSSLLIRNIKVYHGVELNPRQQHIRCPFRIRYKFMNFSHDSFRALLRCPFCWFYCGKKDFKRIEVHIRNCHIDGDNQEDPEDPEDDDGYDECNKFNEYDEYDDCDAYTEHDEHNDLNKDIEKKETRKPSEPEIALKMIMEGIKRLLNR